MLWYHTAELWLLLRHLSLLLCQYIALISYNNVALCHHRAPFYHQNLCCGSTMLHCASVALAKSWHQNIPLFHYRGPILLSQCSIVISNYSIVSLGCWVAISQCFRVSLHWIFLSSLCFMVSECHTVITQSWILSLTIIHYAIITVYYDIIMLNCDILMFYCVLTVFHCTSQFCAVLHFTVWQHNAPLFQRSAPLCHHNTVLQHRKVG